MANELLTQLYLELSNTCNALTNKEKYMLEMIYALLHFCRKNVMDIREEEAVNRIEEKSLAIANGTFWASPQINT